MQSLMQLVRIDEAINALGGVFPGDDDFNYLHLRPGGNYIASRWSRIVGLPRICTRAEFEARKAERQNKPSWDDAPAWANWLAQDDQGLWIFSQGKLLCDFIKWTGQGRAFATGCVGEVIGDWRNTLEQRPNHIGESDEKGALNFDLEMDIAKSSPVLALHLAKEKLEAYQDGRCKQLKWQELCHRNESKHASYIQANVVEPWLKIPMTAEAKPGIDFEWLANQFDDADDINAVWALRDKLHHKNKPETSPELSFHLSNAFNELQASARLLPEDDPRRASIVSLAGGVSAVKEVA